MKKLIEKYWPILTILLFGLLISWPIFLPGYFTHHDDLQVMRIFEMRKCFEDMQIPCRWVPDMGYGNGFPLFNYYGNLPYYIGAFLSYPLGYINSAKILFLIPLVLGGLSAYLLSYELFKKQKDSSNTKIISLTAAILYLFAPYRAVDIYVRGAVAESFAMAIVPFAFYFSLKLIRSKNLKNFLGFVISFGLFLLCHNIMTMFFTPMLVAWIIFWVILEKLRNVYYIGAAFLLGIGLAAYFLIPAFIEKNLVQTETLTRYDLDFRVHFVTVYQLFFDRSWGYGASGLGNNDNLSFQIGWPHWILMIVSSIFAGWYFLKHRITNKNPQILAFLFFLVVFSFSVIMMHNKSAAIWELVKTVQYSQFPWRFLSVTILVSSIGGVFFLNFLTGKRLVIISSIIILIAILLNFSYFRPERIYPLTDKEKLSGKLWEEQQKAGIFDYLPKSAIEAREPAPNFPLIKEGKANISHYEPTTNDFSFYALVYENTKVEMPIYDFPEWTVYRDGQKMEHDAKNHIGRISFTLNPGKYEVSGKLLNTPVRTISNAVSLMTIFLLVILVYIGRKKNIFNEK